MSESNGNGRSIRSIPERSTETMLLVERIRALGVGDVLSYADMSKAIGRNVQTESRHNLVSACRILNREEGYLVVAVRNVGVKRLPPSEFHTIAQASIKSIGRKARRTGRRIRFASEDAEMDHDTQVRTIASLSALNAIASCTKTKKLKALECEIRDTTSELPVGRALDVFKK